MTPAKNLNLRAGLLSVLIFLALLGIWYIATASSGAGNSTAGMTAEQIEYAKMMGKDPGASAKGSGLPPLAMMGRTGGGHCSNRFLYYPPHGQPQGQLLSSTGRAGPYPVGALVQPVL